MPVCAFVTVTAASRTTAPLGSTATTMTVAVFGDCAKAETLSNSDATRTAVRRIIARPPRNP
jgi:hypothetical protein